MHLIQLLNIRMLIIMFEPIHARRRQVTDNDAPVRRELDRLRGMEAVVRAVLEGGEVLPGGETGVDGGHVAALYDWRLDGCGAVAGCPGADADAATE